MFKDVTNRAQREADLTPAHIEELADGLPDPLSADLAECGNDARALGALGLQLLRRYNRLSTTLETLLPTGDLVNGGDLVTAVSNATGLTTVYDVLMGLAQAVSEATASMPNEADLELCRRHAEDYVDEIGDPVVLTLQDVKSLQEQAGGEGPGMTDQERIDRLEGWCAQLEEFRLEERRRMDGLLSLLGVLGDTLGAGCTRYAAGLGSKAEA